MVLLQKFFTDHHGGAEKDQVPLSSSNPAINFYVAVAKILKLPAAIFGGPFLGSLGVIELMSFTEKVFPSSSVFEISVSVLSSVGRMMIFIK